MRRLFLHFQYIVNALDGLPIFVKYCMFDDTEWIDWVYNSFIKGRESTISGHQKAKEWALLTSESEKKGMCNVMC